MATGKIKKVAGPLVIAEGMRDANMYDVVRVSESRLIGEIIEMHGDQFRYTRRHQDLHREHRWSQRECLCRLSWDGTYKQYIRWNPETAG